MSTSRIPLPKSSLQVYYGPGELTLERQAVLKDLGRYLRVPFAALVCSAFGRSSDTDDVARIRNELTNDGILVGGETLRWTDFATRPSQSIISESVTFQPLEAIISKIFNLTSECQLSFFMNPSATPLSERANTSRPDAYVVRGQSHTDSIHWFDIAIPFEFKKSNDRNSKSNNEQKMIWSLHHIMREDPLRRFALGITIEDTDLRFWYSNRALLAVSLPIDFSADIDEVISLFSLLGKMDDKELGWDPTVERIRVGNEIQYKFTIGNQVYTTTRALSTHNADRMVGNGTRVYEAHDENGNTVAIKDSWREKDREPEGAIVVKILQDIRGKLGQVAATEAETHFVRIRAYEDVMVYGELDATFNPKEKEPDMDVKWIDTDTMLSGRLHIPSTGDISDSGSFQTKLIRGGFRSTSSTGRNIPSRVHIRTVFDDVGIVVTDVRCLADSLRCLFGALRALYYLHKAGWVHRDFSVSNVLWVEKDCQWVGKLTDFEYAKRVDSELTPDTRTGTMDFIAVEVEDQHYRFHPRRSFDCFDSSPIPEPHFRMNFLHDLESLWWATMWIFFYHTDANSPSKQPEAQLRHFYSAFPGTIRLSSRRDFFTRIRPLRAAYGTLSATYRKKCLAIFGFAGVLQKHYTKAEIGYPNISLDDHLLNKAHGDASAAYSAALEELEGSDIQLQPVHRIEARKRNIEDSPTGPAAKRARQA